MTSPPRQRLIVVLAILVMLLPTVVCQSRSRQPGNQEVGSLAATASPRVPSGKAVDALAIPSASHIFLIVMENKEYGDVIGNAQAPFINGLAARYALADHYFAIRHPSLPNYLALVGGDTFGVGSDCTGCLQDKPNLVDDLEAAGKTWKSYQEGLPSPCYRGTSAGSYAVRHDPFMYFRDIRSDPARCGRVVPLQQLGADIQAGQVPNFSFITPNLAHDMHDGSVATGDSWLSGFVPVILNSEAWRDGGVLFIVWDEGSSGGGCCGLAYGGHVPLLVITPTRTAGARIVAPATHYSLLRTIEDLWKLPALGQSGDPGVRSLLSVVK